MLQAVIGEFNRRDISAIIHANIHIILSNFQLLVVIFIKRYLDDT